MTSMFELAIAVSILLANVGMCMAGSRCTKISTPCLQVERIVKKDSDDSKTQVNQNRDRIQSVNETQLSES